MASPHRAPHHPHGPPPPHPAAFYPHPLVYWPYPSPPVSPTTYFSQPTHSPTHVPGSHGPPMVGKYSIIMLVLVFAYNTVRHSKFKINDVRIKTLCGFGLAKAFL